MSNEYEAEGQASSWLNYADHFEGKHVLITGGLGFIGSNLAHRLVELGARVLIVDSLIPQYGGNLFNIAGIDDRVRWAGYQDDLPGICAAADLLLFTAAGSDWGHRVISEAQGCGLPVVATAIAGVEDLVEDGRTGVVVPGDPELLADAVDRLVRSSERRTILADDAVAVLGGSGYMRDYAVERHLREGAGHAREVLRHLDRAARSREQLNVLSRRK